MKFILMAKYCFSPIRTIDFSIVVLAMINLSITLIHETENKKRRLNEKIKIDICESLLRVAVTFFVLPNLFGLAYMSTGLRVFGTVGQQFGTIFFGLYFHVDLVQLGCYGLYCFTTLLKI